MNKNYEYYKTIINENLFAYLPDISPHAEVLNEAIRYSLESGGKRLRPVLLLASVDLAGGDIAEAIPFACAIEYIHTSSLIHDDLPCMDDDDLRRGRPTSHIVFGEANAVLAGDSLLNTAYQVMAESISSSDANMDKKEKMIKAISIIAKAAGIQGMMAGQTVDLLSEGKKISPELMEYIHMNKTGRLIKAPILAGLALGDVDDSVVAVMDEFADCLGLSFQIADDILDVEGNPELLGKSIGKDEESHKSTYVSLYGMDKAKEMLKSYTEKSLNILDELNNDTSFFKNLVIEFANRES